MLCVGKAFQVEKPRGGVSAMPFSSASTPEPAASRKSTKVVIASDRCSPTCTGAAAASRALLFRAAASPLSDLVFIKVCIGKDEGSCLRIPNDFPPPSLKNADKQTSSSSRLNAPGLLTPFGGRVLQRFGVKGLSSKPDGKNVANSGISDKSWTRSPWCSR